MLRIIIFLALTQTSARAEPATLPAGMPMETYSLERSVGAAIDNSAKLHTASKGIDIARERVLEARLRFLPDVGLQATATRFHARRPFALGSGHRSTLLFPSKDDYLYSGQGYAVLPLYEGRQNINTLRLARTALRQAQRNFETVKLDVVYHTKEAFYRMLVARSSLEHVERTLKIVDSASRGANVNAWQKVETTALSCELRALLTESRRDEKLAHLDLLKALNLELDRPIRIEGDLQTLAVDVELHRALVWATELRPELQSQTLRAEMDSIGVNLALGRRYPNVFLGVDYELTGTEFPLRQNNWDATLGVRLPFAWDFWTQHSQKVIEQRRAEIRRSDLRDLVHLEVRKAHQDLTYWQEEWRQREKEYNDLLRLLEEARQETARPIDVVRAAASLLHAGRRHLSSVAAHMLARAKLERAVGRALPTSP